MFPLRAIHSVSLLSKMFHKWQTYFTHYELYFFEPTTENYIHYYDGFVIQLNS